jgi:micrococcal nuclease
MLASSRRGRLSLSAPMLLALAVPAASECRLEPGPRRTVTQVLDGETLRLDDGSEVRLAGALAPRGIDAGVSDADWPAAVAARTALQTLAGGQTVALGYTTSTRHDRQNRHLAQAFVISETGETWVQGHMLSTGHARASQQRDARGCAQELLAHEQVARQEGRGVWSIAAYQTRLATRTRDLNGMSTRFAVLKGRVAWVAEGREQIALGFSPSRGGRWQSRRGTIILIDGRDRDLLGTLGGDAKRLEGTDVEVRGWLEQRISSPPGTFVIDLSSAGLITGASPPAGQPAAEPSSKP